MSFECDMSFIMLVGHGIRYISTLMWSGTCVIGLIAPLGHFISTKVECDMEIPLMKFASISQSTFVDMKCPRGDISHIPLAPLHILAVIYHYTTLQCHNLLLCICDISHNTLCCESGIWVHIHQSSYKNSWIVFNYWNIINK